MSESVANSQVEFFIPFRFQSGLFDLCTDNTPHQFFFLPLLQLLLLDSVLLFMHLIQNSQPTIRITETYKHR